jgi:hypothetical protein
MSSCEWSAVQDAAVEVLFPGIRARRLWIGPGGSQAIVLETTGSGTIRRDVARAAVRDGLHAIRLLPRGLTRGMDNCAGVGCGCGP